MRRTAWVAAAVAAACIWCGPAGAEEKPAGNAPPAGHSPMAGVGPAFGPPGDPAEWGPLAAFTDEFNSPALDLAKWHPTNPKWKGRQPGYFSPANVAIADGKLNITMKKETLPDAPKGYHTFTCGAVKSTAAVLYGFFAVKARAMNSRGSSAFWFYDDGPDRWTEIDVFEIGAGAPGHQRKVHMNVHVFRTPLEPNRHWSKASIWEAPFDLAADFHIYALEWDEREIKWYVDGVLRRTSENTHWHQPLYMNFDSETMPDWFGLPEDRQLPSTFSIEYVRAWQKKAGYPKVEGEKPGPPAAGKK